ncbi:hypothetical protein C8J56DRAFT_879512 [Mycena floridula]|nr:hypothetical protein C8J56DRAFT_879512 [Mycena floridula]
MGSLFYFVEGLDFKHPRNQSDAGRMLSSRKTKLCNRILSHWTKHLAGASEIQRPSIFPTAQSFPPTPQHLTPKPLTRLCAIPIVKSTPGANHMEIATWYPRRRRGSTYALVLAEVLVNDKRISPKKAGFGLWKAERSERNLQGKKLPKEDLWADNEPIKPLLRLMEASEEEERKGMPSGRWRKGVPAIGPSTGA